MRDFFDRPFEWIMGVALIVIGALMAALLSDPMWQVGGSVLAAAGGGLLSYVAGDVRSRRKATAILVHELHPISRDLSGIASHLSRTVQACDSGAVSHEIALDRVLQAASTIYGVVNDLNLLVGERPSLQPLIETIQEAEGVMGKAQTMMEAAEVSNEDLEIVRKQLESARLQLQSAQREMAAPETPKNEEHVSCVNCGNTCEVRLGLVAGDSATHTCSTCKTRFHVHRRSDGSVFTRPWGEPTQVRIPLDTKCPVCSRVVHLNFNPDHSDERRFCWPCGTFLVVDKSGTVVSSRQITPTRSQVVGKNGTRSMLSCPTCGKSLAAFWKKGTILRAGCVVCQVLLEAETAQDSAASNDSSVAIPKKG